MGRFDEIVGIPLTEYFPFRQTTPKMMFLRLKPLQPRLRRLTTDRDRI